MPRSGTAYHEWAEREVQEGRRWYPEKRSASFPVHDHEDMRTVAIRHAGGSSSLQLRPRYVGEFILDWITCTGFGGRNQDYEKGKERFCETVHASAFAYVQGIYYISEDILCGDAGGNCDLYMNMIVRGAQRLLPTHPGEWARDQLDDLCGQWWDTIHERCEGKGGSAKVIFTGNPDDACGKPTCKSAGSIGKDVGQVWYEWGQHDAGETCPDDDQYICKIERW